MEIAGLALAIPPTVSGILKCIKLFKGVSEKFQGVDDRVQRIISICRMLELALLQLEAAGVNRPDEPLSFITANCAKAVKSMEMILRKLGVNPDDPSALKGLNRIECVWKDDEIASLMKLVDECRDDIQFFFTLQLHQFQAPNKLEQSSQHKKRARYSSIIQSDDETLRFSFLSNNSKFSTMALNINPDRASLASVQFSFDQAIQASRVYRKFASEALPLLPLGTTVEDDDAQAIQDVKSPNQNTAQETQSVETSEDISMNDDDMISGCDPLLMTIAENPTLDQERDFFRVRETPKGRQLHVEHGNTRISPDVGVNEHHFATLPEATFQITLPGMVKSTTVKCTMYAQAVYDYQDDVDLTTLSFSSGDFIAVLEQLESGWWDGVHNGVRGWFPSNYCRIMS